MEVLADPDSGCGLKPSLIHQLTGFMLQNQRLICPQSADCMAAAKPAAEICVSRELNMVLNKTTSIGGEITATVTKVFTLCT